MKRNYEANIFAKLDRSTAKSGTPSKFDLAPNSGTAAQRHAVLGKPAPTPKRVPIPNRFDNPPVED